MITPLMFRCPFLSSQRDSKANYGFMEFFDKMIGTWMDPMIAFPASYAPVSGDSKAEARKSSDSKAKAS